APTRCAAAKNLVATAFLGKNSAGHPRVSKIHVVDHPNPCRVPAFRQSPGEIAGTAAEAGDELRLFFPTSRKQVEKGRDRSSEYFGCGRGTILFKLNYKRRRVWK